jgi:hypothetical protein
MTDIEARVADLINFSSNQRPIDFEDAFKSIIQNKVFSAIENKKEEIAQAMFAAQDESDDEEETEEYFETED